MSPGILKVAAKMCHEDRLGDFSAMTADGELGCPETGVVSLAIDLCSWASLTRTH